MGPARADEAIEEVLDADMRAMLCAVLASAAWIEAGARWVTPIAPCSKGWDFNDQRQARLAGALGNRPAVLEVGLIAIGDTDATRQFALVE